MNGNYSTEATTKEACSVLNVSAETLRRWAKDGKIKHSKTPGGQRRYDLRDYLGTETATATATATAKTTRKRIIYARVSSPSQKNDLERQVEHLQEQYPEYQVITDVGSGLNFKRKGLKTLVEYLVRGEIQEIVVTHRDRLARFGFELFELILSQTNPDGEIVVLDDRTTSPEEELANDLITIITVFSSRLYGLRSHQNRLRKIIENSGDKDISRPGSEEEIKDDV